MIVKLKERKEIVKGVWQYTLDLNGQQIIFEPGQFFTLTLFNPPFTDNRGNSRIFGFTNSPGKTDIEFITHTGPSAFKKSLEQLPVGSEMEIDKVNGERVLPQDSTHKIVLIADVIGLAPFLSILRKVRDDKLDFDIKLFYVFENSEKAIFLSELESFANENSKFKLVTTNAFVLDLITRNLQEPNNYKYFIRGEQKFVVPVFSALKSLEIDASNLSMEIFTGY
jgi:predicted ferric reductase